MAAAPDQVTVDAFLDVIRGAITAGTLTIPPVHVPPDQAPIIPPQLFIKQGLNELDLGHRARISRRQFVTSR
ncbi:hypothetical protein RHMOL_Rhmol13G0047800 [Rhododendron molle]|uniref:Uncharacterized protein n=1 Tax=Rhododendron molle TaxID=49168 RepID=A0ACC0L3Z2_RHOML|nr:hypothetical protein RHMOL_Rhmol13G0047800 [Rhododendron molle]